MEIEKLRISDEHMAIIQEYEKNPYKFAELFRSVGLFGLTGSIKCNLDMPHLKHAFDIYAKYDKMINLWCNRAAKWAFESIIMLWEAMFHKDKTIVFAEHGPNIVQPDVTIADGINPSSTMHNPPARMVSIVGSMYQYLPAWLAELYPVHCDEYTFSITNGSTIRFPITAMNYTEYDPNVLILHGIDRMSDYEFKDVMMTYFPKFFTNNPKKFKAILFSEGGQRGTMFETLCRTSTDLTKVPIEYSYGDGWVLDVVRANDIPDDTAAEALNSLNHIPWPYEGEFT